MNKMMNKKEKLLYPFNECIFEKYQEECLTSYPATEIPECSIYDNIAYYFATSANEYFEASKVIVNSLKIQGNDDVIVQPLLSLYVHCLEFNLKAVIYKLMSHSKECIRSIHFSLFEEKKLKTHSLKALCNVLGMLIPKKGLHYLEYFDEIRTFILKIDEMKLNSESTRYVFKKNLDDIHEFRHQQWQINLEKFHNNISTVFNMLLKYYESNDWEACELGFFSKERIEELENTKNNLQIFDKISLEKVIKIATKEQLINLSLALNIGRGIHHIRYAVIKNYSENELINSVSKNWYCFQEARIEIEKEIKNIKVILNIDSDETKI